jgi:hypothetical protein
MYDVCKKKLGVCSGLVDKISPAFESRNSDVPAVVPGILCCSSWILGGIDSRRCAEALQAAVSSWAVSGLYLPKAVLAALASLYPFPVTALPSSPAYTYLKEHLQPLQIFNQKI